MVIDNSIAFIVIYRGTVLIPAIFTSNAYTRFNSISSLLEETNSGMEIILPIANSNTAVFYAKANRVSKDLVTKLKRFTTFPEQEIEAKKSLVKEAVILTLSSLHRQECTALIELVDTSCSYSVNTDGCCVAMTGNSKARDGLRYSFFKQKLSDSPSDWIDVVQKYRDELNDYTYKSTTVSRKNDIAVIFDYGTTISQREIISSIVFAANLADKTYSDLIDDFTRAGIKGGFISLSLGAGSFTTEHEVAPKDIIPYNSVEQFHDYMDSMEKGDSK